MKNLPKLLRVMHSDLKQGAFFTENEDPEWDVTVEAAHEIERLSFFLDFLYDSLGPADDEIMTMAQEAWEQG